MIDDRITEFRNRLDKNKLDAMLISKPENIRYLSGFTGGSDAVLLVSSHHQYIITDSRYTEQVHRECPGWELRLEKPASREELVNLSKMYKDIGFESQYLTHHEYVELEKNMPGQFIPLLSLVEAQRIIKEEEELDLLRKAAQIGDRVFSEICSIIQTDVSEKHIANQIVYFLKDLGCDKESFDTISVSGANAALPHGQPGDKLLKPGDMLTLDYGGFYKGYASDMTRTIAIDRAEQKLIDRYQAVLEAQLTGLSMVKEGARCKDIDQSIRRCLKKYDMDKYFIHGTGHGVGLEIHEAPRVSFGSDEILKKNMVITIEPGIYISGWGGIRIEDTVIVKDGGCEVITHSDKELLIIDGGIK
ncbi:aminopeptidase ypdf (mp-, ma-, ms-, ap-, np- specific) [hydrocarbon metagenome]|uniref:Aminopeptidase ypdf (Mp-, ma-, ms-, ap-, np-specific) n=1 Tax=hydrocarbon metagenome TaxID=938273 RepID=A0A0W8E9F1_9ZZZZ